MNFFISESSAEKTLYVTRNAPSMIRIRKIFSQVKGLQRHDIESRYCESNRCTGVALPIPLLGAGQLEVYS